MKVAILNDTSTAKHFGCKLTMEVLYDQLNKRGIEVIGSVAYNETIQRELLEKADLVIVNGEGSIHNNRRPELIDIANHFPAVLINAVYQNNIYNEALKKFKYISVRESLSQAALKEQGIDAEIVPDLVFASETLRTYKHEPTKGQCIVDSEGSQGSHDLSANSPNFLEELVEYDKVCTGRFHGIVASAVLGIPFTAYGSNTQKNKGLMLDMGARDNFVNNFSIYGLYEPQKTNGSIDRYACAAPIRINDMFDKITRSVI